MHYPSSASPPPAGEGGRGRRGHADGWRLLRRRRQRAASRHALNISVVPTADALGPMRGDVRVFLQGFDVPARVIGDVLLALQEACKNAVRFSGSPASIDITVAVEPDDVRLVVRDHGGGFDPPPAPTGPPDPLEACGRGLYLMSALMDDCLIRRDHGTIVCMTRRLPG